MISLLNILKINGIFQKKLSGKAMFYALFLTLIFAILSSVVLLSFFSFENAHLDFQEARSRINHLNSGINWILSQGEDKVDKKEISLLGEDWKSIEIMKKDWGLLELGSVRAYDTLGTTIDTIQRIFLIGNIRGKNMKNALFLCDTGKPLKLVGQSGINGDVQIPKAGIEAGFVEGKGFLGKELVNGKINSSFPSLPSLNMQKIKQLFSNTFQELPAGSISNDETSLDNSFDEPTLKLKPLSNHMENVRLKGNIIIWSSSPLYLAHTCHLEEVIIFAPKITFGSGFKGSIQAYATQEIILEEQVDLSDPSILGVLTNASINEGAGKIEVKGNTNIAGLVFLLKQEYSRKEPELFIAKKSRLVGQVVCDGYLHLAGEINGNATAKKMRLKTNAAVYDNLILDGRLINNDTEYCVPNIFVDQNSKKGVLKWCR